MKYVIIGSLGNTSKPISIKLISTGNEVTIVTSRKENIKTIEALGAAAAVGSVEDADFLTDTFMGAGAVFTLVPPTLSATDWKSWIEGIGKNYAKAIEASGVKFVVNLSSIGADLPGGVGPVTGLHRVEETLNKLTGVNIKHLRPAYFYFNLFSNIPLIKNAGIMGSNFAIKEKKFPIVHPDDVAIAAAEELMRLDFSGHSARYIVGDEVSTDEIAAEIGGAIDKPGLPWVYFTNEQAFDGMKGAGLQDEIAKNYVEMGDAINSGKMSEDYWKHHPDTLGKIKLVDFAKEFAQIYKES
ncbi:MAG: NAD(P)H-binding protein [Ginsengibacter sp.]